MEKNTPGYEGVLTQASDFLTELLIKGDKLGGTINQKWQSFKQKVDDVMSNPQQYRYKQQPIRIEK